MEPAVLKGPRAAEAELVRQAAELERLVADLRGYLDRLSSTQLAAEARTGLAEVPGVLEGLWAVDDAEWWLTHQRRFRPLDSEWKYERYPGELWTFLLREFGGGRRLGQAPIAGEFGVEEVVRDVYEALAPQVPAEVVAALRKGGHRLFLNGPSGFVAIHDRGVRFVGPTGKVVAKNVPKGQGSVTHWAMAADGSVLVGNVPWGVHRVDPTSGALESYAAPVGIGEQGFCALTDGVAIMDPTGALRLCRFGGADLDEIARVEHPDLPPRAALESLMGAPDLLLARCLGDAGRIWTLVGSWQRGEFRWLGRLEFGVHGARRAPDGSLVASVDRARCVRLRL